MTLEEKKAAIEKLIDEVGTHLARLEQIPREMDRLMGTFADFIKEHGEAGIPVARELFAKMQRYVAKLERLKLGGDPHGPS